jgi:hypothetical protein
MRQQRMRMPLSQGAVAIARKASHQHLSFSNPVSE